MYLERSQDIGIKTEEEFARNSWNLTDEERISAFNENMNDGVFLSRDTVGYGLEHKRKWLIAKYQPGDVIIHNPYIVHASCRNCDPGDRIRLATDMRFVETGTHYDKARL
jgi:phytanoyl-CoA hydroxylase